MENTNNSNISNDLFVKKTGDTGTIEDIQGSSLSFWKDAQLRFVKNKASLISLIVLVLVILISIFGPFVGSYNLNSDDFEDYPATYNYNGSYQHIDYKFLPPRVPVIENLGILDGVDENGVDLYEQAGAKDYYFIFGTDNFGRDLFVRICVGTLISVLFGLTAAALDILIGVSLGGISGFFGGRIDLFLQRLVEILGTVPRLIWVIILVLFYGSGFLPLVLALVISGWIPMYRVVRGQVFKIKEQEFVLSSKTLGGSSISIIFKHILPNTIGVIIIWLMFTIPGAIFFESFLSYIGMGIQVPTPSLGTLTSDGRQYLDTYSYILFVPTLTLSLIMLTFNLVADGLRDAFDPKMRGGE